MFGYIYRKLHFRGGGGGGRSVYFKCIEDMIITKALFRFADQIVNTKIFIENRPTESDTFGSFI